MWAFGLLKPILVSMMNEPTLNYNLFERSLDRVERMKLKVRVVGILTGLDEHPVPDQVLQLLKQLNIAAAIVEHRNTLKTTAIVLSSNTR